MRFTAADGAAAVEHRDVTQYSFAQQIEFRSAKHLPFDQFEAIDIPFNWTGAPVHSKTRVYR